MIVDWTKFLAHAVHDVRSFTRAGLVNAQFLQLELGQKDGRGSRLDKIVAAQQNLDRLTAGIMRFTEAASLDEEAMWQDVQQLKTVILGARLEAAEDLKRNGTPEAFSYGDVPACLVPSRIQMVLSEWIRNAVRFQDPSRPLSISLVAGQPDPGTVRLEVTDNGIGWEKAQTSLLFEPFVRLHAGRSGSGLGLATCRALIEAAGGRIWAAPKARGATFGLELPCRPLR